MKTASTRQTVWSLAPSHSVRNHAPKPNKNEYLHPSPPAWQSRSKMPSIVSRDHPHTTQNTPDVSDKFSTLHIERLDLEKEPLTQVTQSIEVHAPLAAVYQAWTRFKAFPHFMRGEDVVARLDESRMVWPIRIGFETVPLEAEMVMQIPNEIIAWRSAVGHRYPNSGEVQFEAVNQLLTRIHIQFDLSPCGAHRWSGNPLNSLTQCLDWSLRSFRSVTELHIAYELEWSNYEGAAVA